MQVRTAKDLGAIIKEARKNLGISQKYLANQIGVHQPKISEIERGAPGVGIGLVLQILKALNLVMHIDKALKAKERSDSSFIDLDAIANTGLD